MHQTSLFIVSFILFGCGRSELWVDDVQNSGRDAAVDAGRSEVDVDARDVLDVPPDVFADVQPDVEDLCVPDPISRCLGGQPGSLIKGTGPAVYYIARDCHRYVFPNENTFYTWYPDFTTVCPVADAYLAAIPIGGNVMFRPGTWLGKITTDPKVYAVTPCGVLHWIQTESVAIQLYGPDWARRVHDIPDAFFVNYTIGASISTPVHPDGTLVSYAGSPDIYLISSGQRRRFGPGAFAANRFQDHDPRDPSVRFVVETSIVYPDGPPIVGREPTLEETVCVP